MKAIIKVVTAAPAFTEYQKQILRRVQMVLIEHGLSIYCEMKIKKQFPAQSNIKLKKI